MAFDKIIDSAQLESDLTSVAAAIRAKGATADPLSFPAGFVSAVNNIFTSSAFGYIVASFPTTAVSCTCSSGGTVLQADAAGLARGQFVFEVPAAGTWTVTISNGTDTKSESVSITTAGQAEKVTLAYWSGELYDAGNQYTDITGGWIRHGTGGTVTFNDDNIYLEDASAYVHAAVDTTNAVDLTDYATLKVTATTTDKRWMLGKVILYTKDTAGKETIAASASLDSSSTETVTSLDVSALSGAYYVRIQSSGTNSSYYIVGKFNVTKVKLEAAA